MDEQELRQIALDCGAKNVALIDGAAVVLSAEFRKICQGNACGGYNRCYMCPPDIGNIECLMEKVRQYSRGLLYQSIGKIEDSFDIEGMTASAVEHARLSQRIQERCKGLLPAGFLHLSCGGCRLCETCAKQTGEPCRHPDKAISSMEGYGIDVYRTVAPTEMKYINGQDTVTFFGILLWKE